VEALLRKKEKHKKENKKEKRRKKKYFFHLSNIEQQKHGLIKRKLVECRPNIEQSQNELAHRPPTLFADPEGTIPWRGCK
jgi:hypothetical protein